MRTPISLAPALVAALLVGACSRGPAPKLENEVTMKVTDKGFEPQDLRVQKGQPVKLTITRVSDATCATEIVIDEHNIQTKLPLNEAVSVTFTPKTSGQLKYGCAMDKMIGGIIRIE
jgi:plastocyanin domain-containing protein